MVTVVTLEIADLPPSVQLEIPALSVCCFLAGGQGVEWPEEAKEDRERMVRVNLRQGGVKMVDRLEIPWPLASCVRHHQSWSALLPSCLPVICCLSVSRL